MNTYTAATQQRQGEFFLILTALLFGSFGLFAKALGEYLSPSAITFAVCLLQFTGFGIWMALKKIPFTVSGHAIYRVLFFSVINLLPLFFFTSAIHYMGIGAVLLVQNTVTLFVSLLIEYIATKKASPIQVALMIIALAALAIIYLPFEIASMFGILFACGVGAANALANKFRGELGAEVQPEKLSFYSTALGTVVWGIIVLLSYTGTGNVGIISWRSTLILALYAILNIATTFLLNKGFAKVPLTLGNTLLLLEIVIGYGLGALVFHEQYGMYQIAGSIILFAAIFSMKILPNHWSTTSR